MSVSFYSMIFAGDKICSRSDTGERRAVTGMSTPAAQLETGVKFHETWWYSAVDGACVHGSRLDFIYWKVSIGVIVFSSSMTIGTCTPCPGKKESMVYYA